MDYQKFMDHFNHHDQFGVSSGIRLVKMEEGYSEVEAEITDNSNFNYMDSLHGGFIFTMADVAAGTAVTSYGTICVTLNATVHFMRPILKGHLKAIGRVIHYGRTTSISQVEIRDENQQLVCQCSCTMYLTGKKVEL